MFVRVHRPGVDVEVGVHLDGGDVEARVGEKTPGAGGGDALAQPGHHTARDEHELPTHRGVVPRVGICWHIDRPSGRVKTVSDPTFRVDVRVNSGRVGLSWRGMCHRRGDDSGSIGHRFISRGARIRRKRRQNSGRLIIRRGSCL
ncbi:hypothetical protein BN903_1 [Halorubrum sp. AJ67]|nr:hypothetical protein BN903_1 [Halorubrum sp. AJ67]